MQTYFVFKRNYKKDEKCNCQDRYEKFLQWFSLCKFCFEKKVHTPRREDVDNHPEVTKNSFKVVRVMFSSSEEIEHYIVPAAVIVEV